MNHKIKLETDYLIIGSGAVGMAFADVLLHESDARMVIVDRYAKPGGHWNHAYPFVTLHQPSQYYGVSSRELGAQRIDQIGWNKGLYELATVDEIRAYFEAIMREDLLPSGRVEYYPLCEYAGDGIFRAMMSGQEYEVSAKKIVDCTYLRTQVPKLHTPNFEVSSEVRFMPVNDLVTIDEPPTGYVIIGGGKTGVDAILWLLSQAVDPALITWVISRDGWMLDRENTQPTEAFFDKSMGAMAAQMECAAQATSVEDLFDRLEEAGVLVRLDPEVRPTMFHGATISQEELSQLRRVKNVIRRGRVQEITDRGLRFADGWEERPAGQVYVDCSATAIRQDIEVIPIFDGDTITPQTVRSYQPVFSAAFIAHVELARDTIAEKNQICQVVPLPNHHTDWIPMTIAQMMNQFSWSQHKDIRNWLKNNRLDGFANMLANMDREDEAKIAILTRLRNNALPAMMNLQKLAAKVTTKTINMNQAQYQVKKDMFFKGEAVELPNDSLTLGEGDVLVEIDRFAYTSNNITYAVAGDFLRYWQFFPPVGEQATGWGVIPVWGFADVVESRSAELPVGERLFGYFPPATHLKMHIGKATPAMIMEGSEHRRELPKAYNMYRRVHAEPGYDKAADDARAMLYPLYLTAYCIGGTIADADYYGAEQILILSASSKTSIGVGYMCQELSDAPRRIGMTSSKNLKTVQALNLYDEVLTYDQVDQIAVDVPTLIIDMSGNQGLLVQLHTRLGDQMKHTINVGLTHWTDARPQKGIIKERSSQFFAPSYMVEKAREIGQDVFNQKVDAFIQKAAAQTLKWLTVKEVKGIEGLANIHAAVCEGKIPADQGIMVALK